MKIIDRLIESRFWALVLKEVNQILKDKQLLFLLLFPPTVQLLIFGFALSPEVNHLKLGVVDYSNTPASRELVAAFTANGIFDRQNESFSQRLLGEQVRTGQITAGLVIPLDFNRKLSGEETAEVQVLIDAVDANTAGIASGYTTQIINQYSRGLDPDRAPDPIEPRVAILYNPGLNSSWFFVPGVLGLVLTLTSSLVSSSTVVREKDTGTLEQLLMTPAAAWEILLAKIAPLYILLMGDVFLALGLARLAFDVPFRGNFLLFLILSSLYIFVGIGVGTLLATVVRDQRQVVLTSFFINLPLIQLSGAIAPVESMPPLIRYLSLLDPLRYYIEITRGLMLKGVGLEVLWPQALALLLFAILLLAVSVRQFRSQLS